MPADTTTTGRNDATDSTPDKDKWTLMFYIAGDAALSASMISQLKEVTDAGFQKDTNVLLYFDPNCNGKGARIYDVNHYRKRKQKNGDKTVIGDSKDPFVRNIAEDCNIQSLPQIPAAISLRYFLTYSRSYYPAENYMLFMMGHGVIVGNDQFLPDDDDGSSVTLAQLGAILREFGEKVRKTKDEFHLVGFHSCGMSSVELAFEIQGSAQYMMGTQGSAFPGSWPYRQLLKKIFNCIEKDKNDQTGEYPHKLVREILKGLQNLSFYNAQDFWHAGFSADLSMCSLREKPIAKLKKALEGLAIALKEGLKNGAKEPILLAHWESQSFFGESYTDLYDFCECLQEYYPKSASQHPIRQACKAVIGVLESERSHKDPRKAKRKEFANDPEGLFDQMVVFSDYFGPAYQHANGLSILLPWKDPVEKVMTSYENYEFTKAFGSGSWLSFLKDYFYLTKRPVKGSKLKKEQSDKSATLSRTRFRLEKLSDDELLRLGPPPRQKKAAMAKRRAALKKEMGTLAKKMAIMEKEMGTLAAAHKGTGTLEKEMGTLAKEMGTLSKEMGTLAASGKDPAALEKEMGTLEKRMGTLAKEMGTLAASGGKEPGTLEKEMGTLAKEMGTLASSGKDPATLEKEMGTLAKEMGTLAAVKGAGTLEKEMGTLSKEMGTLAASGGKTPGTLAKEMGTLGLSGTTVIKNFDAPDNVKISSRPNGKPNQGRKETNL